MAALKRLEESDTFVSICFALHIVPVEQINIVKNIVDNTYSDPMSCLPHSHGLLPVGLCVCVVCYCLFF